MVIELKRPAVEISPIEINQIADYAFEVSKNQRFPRDKTKWKFILIGKAISERAAFSLKKYQGENGYYTGTEDDSLTVWVKDWGQIINEAAARHKYLEENLKLAVGDNSEGMRYLQEKYCELLPEECLNVV